MARNNGVARETLTTKEDTNETRFVNANCKVQIEKCKLSRNIRRTGLAILTFAFCNFHFAFLLRVLRDLRGEGYISTAQALKSSPMRRPKNRPAMKRLPARSKSPRMPIALAI